MKAREARDGGHRNETAWPHRRTGEQPVPRRDDVRQPHAAGGILPDRRPRHRARRQLHRYRQRLFAGHQRDHHRRGAKAQRQARPHRACHQVPRRNGGRRPEHARRQPPSCDRRLRGELDALADGLHRPLPDPSPALGHRHRRNLARPRRPHSPRQGALHRHVHVRGVAVRGSAVGGRKARPEPLCLRTAALQPARPPCRARADAHGADLRRGDHPVEPACWRPAYGQIPPRRRAARWQSLRQRQRDAKATLQRAHLRRDRRASADRRAAQRAALAVRPRLGDGAAWRHQPDHRPAHDGAAGRQPRRRGHRLGGRALQGGGCGDRARANGDPFYEADFGPHRFRI